MKHDTHAQRAYDIIVVLFTIIRPRKHVFVAPATRGGFFDANSGGGRPSSSIRRNGRRLTIGGTAVGNSFFSSQLLNFAFKENEQVNFFCFADFSDGTGEFYSVSVSVSLQAVCIKILVYHSYVVCRVM